MLLVGPRGENSSGDLVAKDQWQGVSRSDGTVGERQVRMTQTAGAHFDQGLSVPGLVELEGPALEGLAGRVEKIA